MALPPSPLLSLRCLPRQRNSRSVCPPISRPLYLGGEGRGSRRSRLSAAPSLPAAGRSAHPPQIRRGPNPPTGTGASPSPRPWAGTTSGHRRPLAQGRALPSFTGEYFSGGSRRSRRGAGRSCTQSRRLCGGGVSPGTAAASPRGLGSLRLRRPLKSPRVRSLHRRGRSGALASRPPRRPADGIGPARKSFASLSPTCFRLKTNEKLFPLVGFVAFGEAASARTAWGGRVPLAPAGSGPSRPPDSLPGRRREGWREFPR